LDYTSRKHSYEEFLKNKVNPVLEFIHIHKIIGLTEDPVNMPIILKIYNSHKDCLNRLIGMSKEEVDSLQEIANRLTNMALYSVKDQI